MGFVEYSRRTFLAAEDIEQYSAVALTADGIAACAAGETPVGFIDVPAWQGKTVGVRLLNTAGTLEALAGGAVNGGDLLNTGAAGTVVTQTAPGGQVVGMAMHSAGAGDILEMMPLTVVGV